MRNLLAAVCLILICCLSVFAQRNTGGSRSPATTPRPRISSPDQTPTPNVYLSGKVVVDDGSILTESAAIESICRGVKTFETHTDSHGNFSFTFGDRLPTTDMGGVEFDADSSTRTSSTGRTQRRNAQECELQASLAGFTSDVIQLGGRFTGESSADVGRIVLHRLTNVEGFTISATTAQAPPSARKALEKGQEQARKGKWDDAEASFQKAVSLFPRFAVAWFELGRVQLHKNDFSGARHSFEQSIAADAKFVNPYHSLTQLAMHDQNWQELVATSEKLLALNPVSFPDAWLANSAGHYYLQNFVAAEKSARRGLEIDTERRVPKLEYILGVVLLQKPDYQGAAQHMRAFLSQATAAADIAEAQKQLEQIARLSAAANPPASP